MHILRRSFLKALPPLLIIFNGAGFKAPIARAKGVLISRFSVAGFQYYQGKEALPFLQVDEALRMIPEPENPHDRFAVEIYKNGYKLGYVPRGDDKHISRLLREGIRLSCRVEDIDNESSPRNVLKVSIALVC